VLHCAALCRAAPSSPSPAIKLTLCRAVLRVLCYAASLTPSSSPTTTKGAKGGSQGEDVVAAAAAEVAAAAADVVAAAAADAGAWQAVALAAEPGSSSQGGSKSQDELHTTRFDEAVTRLTKLLKEAQPAVGDSDVARLADQVLCYAVVFCVVL
jgi:hypothetical protein